MSKAIAIIDMPDCCAECYFRFGTADVYTGNGLYKKISSCKLAPKDIEDPWRDIHWQAEHKEEWCPLKPLIEDPDKKSIFVRHVIIEEE